MFKNSSRSFSCVTECRPEGSSEVCRASSYRRFCSFALLLMMALPSPEASFLPFAVDDLAFGRGFDRSGAPVCRERGGGSAGSPALILPHLLCGSLPSCVCVYVCMCDMDEEELHPPLSKGCARVVTPLQESVIAPLLRRNTHLHTHP